MSREERDRVLFNKIAESYARKDLSRSSSLARKSQLYLALKSGFSKQTCLGTVVDVGCGVGAPAKYLHGHYDHYIGIDQSKEMIEAARAFNRGNSRAHFIVDNVKSKWLPTDVADVILSIGALHHMTELPDVVESLTRIAKKGAFLVIMEPHKCNPLVQAIRRIRAVVDRAYSREQIYFSEQDLVDLLQTANIELLSVKNQGFITPPFAQIAIQPQALSVPLSRFAIVVDAWLDAHLPEYWKKLSYNVVITGRFS